MKNGKISKKKIKKKILSELPPADTYHYWSYDSIKVETDNTFDRLLKGEIYNKVNITKNPDVVHSSDSEISKSKNEPPSITIEKVQSPMAKKLNKRTWTVRKPNSKRNKRRTEEEIERESFQKSNENNLQQKTLDRTVDISLYIEKENFPCNISVIREISHLRDASKNKGLKIIY